MTTLLLLSIGSTFGLCVGYCLGMSRDATLWSRRLCQQKQQAAIDRIRSIHNTAKQCSMNDSRMRYAMRCIAALQQELRSARK